MAFEKGNQWWKNRSKSGRDLIFSSPKQMWESACEYFEWASENPLMEDTIQVLKVNGEGERIQHEQLPKMRPFTMKGLCLYLDCNEEYFRQFKKNINDSPNISEENRLEFSRIITRIEDVIFTQKFEGAAAGFLNANLISRDLGLMDKQEVNLGGSINIAWNEEKTYEAEQKADDSNR